MTSTPTPKPESVVTVESPPDVPLTAVEEEERLAKEWGTYVAAAQIFVDGALAFNAGDPVPAGHIDRKVISEKQVHKITTKAGRAAAGLPEED